MMHYLFLFKESAKAIDFFCSSYPRAFSILKEKNRFIWSLPIFKFKFFSLLDGSAACCFTNHPRKWCKNMKNSAAPSLGRKFLFITAGIKRLFRKAKEGYNSFEWEYFMKKERHSCSHFLEHSFFLSIAAKILLWGWNIEMTQAT